MKQKIVPPPEYIVPLQPGRYASLRGKTLLIIATTLLGLLIVLYIPLRFFLLNSFLELEQHTVQKDVAEIREEISSRLAALERAQAIIAPGVTPSPYAQNMHPSFAIASYPDAPFDAAAAYPDTLFEDYQIELVAITNQDGHIIFSKAYDLEQHRAVPVPADFPAHLTVASLLTPANRDGSHAGIIMLADYPLLVMSQPVVSSLVSGAVAGTSILGRRLDDAQLAAMDSNSQFHLRLHGLDNAGLDARLQAQRDALLAGSTFIVQPRNEQLIAGYALLNALDTLPPLLLEVTLPRTIYAQGQSGVTLVSLTFILTGLIFGGVMLLLLERTILTRMTHLNAQVQHIHASTDPAARVVLAGNDELTSLADNINGMLDALQYAQTEQRQQEEAAKIQEENMRVRREFISTVSHELRTPLTPILGFVDLLLLKRDMNITEEQRGCLHTIKENTLRMRALVDDLLEVGRLDAGRIELELECVDLRPHIDKVAQFWHTELERKAMTLTVQIAADLPPVKADPRRVDQVLHNLLSNAIKYTYPEGRIALRAFERDEHYIEIEIEDTGVGLSLEQQSQLFTPFYRAKNPLHNEVNGTGLGLCIVKSFVELQGGQVRVRSQPNVGSVFAFTLPKYATLPLALENMQVELTQAA